MKLVKTVGSIERIVPDGTVEELRLLLVHACGSASEVSVPLRMLLKYGGEADVVGHSANLLAMFKPR